MKRLLLCLLLTGCTTTTTTFPDGRVVKTSSQDPAVVAAITTGVTNGLSQAAIAAINRNGFLK